MDDARIVYEPLDTPKPVADDLWIVDSGPLHAFGLSLPIRMTVIRLTGGDLLLHSPTRHTPALQRELEALGRIRHLVAPNSGHWMMVKEWQDACPDTLGWAAPGTRDRAQVKASGVRFDHELVDQAPVEWSGEIEQGVFTIAGGFSEVFFFHRASRTLVMTDLVENLEPDKLGWIERVVMRAAGTTAPDGRAVAPIRAMAKLHREEVARTAARLVALAPERLVFSHGAWFDRDGTAELKRSMRWALDD